MVWTAAGEDESPWVNRTHVFAHELQFLIHVHEKHKQPWSFYDLVRACARFEMKHPKFRHACIRKCIEFWGHAFMRNYPKMQDAYEELYRHVLDSYRNTPPISLEEEDDRRYIRAFLRMF